MGLPEEDSLLKIWREFSFVPVDSRTKDMSPPVFPKRPGVISISNIVLAAIFPNFVPKLCPETGLELYVRFDSVHELGTDLTSSLFADPTAELGEFDVLSLNTALVTVFPERLGSVNLKKAI